MLFLLWRQDCVVVKNIGFEIMKIWVWLTALLLSTCMKLNKLQLVSHISSSVKGSIAVYYIELLGLNEIISIDLLAKCLSQKCQLLLLLLFAIHVPVMYSPLLSDFPCNATKDVIIVSKNIPGTKKNIGSCCLQMEIAYFFLSNLDAFYLFLPRCSG